MERNSVRTQEAGFGKRVAAAVMLAAYVSVLTPFQLVAEAVPAEAKPGTAVPAREEKSEVLISARDGGKVVLGEASIEIPEGALKEDTKISITRLHAVEDTGESLYNAIPMAGGYRFLPAGTKFEKDVTITLPYSAELNSKPQSLDELYTYFYDTEAKSWVKLERLEVDREGCKVRSLSSHFTDMINATLTLPEAASPVDVNLNSIKNLEAAKPDSHLIKFNPPKAGNTGDASFSLELSVPAGRRGMQPQVSVGYSSGAGNGIMGRGFDVSYGSCITTDTRLGLPEYDTRDAYMLDGVLLDEKMRSGDTVTYVPQREAQFSRIVRHGAGTESDWWEVTDKGGTKRTYAQSTESCVGGGKRTFTWNLTEMADTRGNTVKYKYAKDDGYVYPDKILYTGSDGKDGNYSVEFHYDGNGVKRQDVRIDARSREIISCRKLLTGITTHYKGGGAIRTYAFEYKEGLAKESMLTSLSVKNNAGESYAYTFGYEEPKKDGNGNTVYFADAEEWDSGQPVQTGSSASTGVNFNTGTSGGYGLHSVDLRTGGGGSGSVSDSESCTEDTLIDIDGDGKPDSVRQDGNSVEVRLNTGSGFGSPRKIQFPSGRFQTDIDREVSSSSSFGWNIYTGTGLKSSKVSCSLGTGYSEVRQKSSSSTKCTFIDMNRDGLADILESGKTTYLKNKGNLVFEEAPLLSSIQVPDVQQTIPHEDAEEYRKTYHVQTPFRMWKAPYEGTASIREDVRAAGGTYRPEKNTVIKTFIGNSDSDKGLETEVKKGSPVSRSKTDFEIEKDTDVYFISDNGKEPINSDVEWSVSIEYSKVKLFKKNYPLPIINNAKLKGSRAFSYSANSTSGTWPSEIVYIKRAEKEFVDKVLGTEALLPLYSAKATVSANGDTATCTVTFTYKPGWKQGMEESQINDIYNALVANGYVYPAVLTPSQFDEYLGLIKESPAGKKDENYYALFASQFVRSVTQNVYMIKKFSDDNAVNAFFTKFPMTGELAAKALENYTVNGCAINLQKTDASYDSVMYSQENSGMRSDRNAGTVLGLPDGGNKAMVIGILDGTPLVYDFTEKKLLLKNGGELSPAPFSYEVVTAGDSITIGVNKDSCGVFESTITISPGNISYEPENLSEHEFGTIANDFPVSYTDPHDAHWILTEEKNLKESEIGKLFQSMTLTPGQKASILEALYQKKDKFKEGGAYDYSYYIFKEAPDYEKAGEVLHEYRKEKVLREMFPFYKKSESGYILDSSRIKTEADKKLLTGKCSKFYFGKASGVRIEQHFETEHLYSLSPDGKFSYLSVGEGLVLSSKTGLLPKIRWESAENFESPEKTEAMDISYTKAVYEYREKENKDADTDTDNAAVTVENDEFLYGGMNNWFFGIWNGALCDVPFSEARLRQFKEEVSQDEFDARKEKTNSVNTDEGAARYNSDSSMLFCLPKSGRETASLYGLEAARDDSVAYPVSYDAVLCGTVSVYSGIAKSGNSRTVKKTYYMPFVSGNIIHVDRIGGVSYYKVEGLYIPPAPAPSGGTPFAMPSIRRTFTEGTDRTPNVSVGVGGSKQGKIIDGERTFDTIIADEIMSVSGSKGFNRSESNVRQMVRDIDGNGIPDIAKVSGGVIEVTKGNLEGSSVSYSSSETFHGAGTISRNKTDVDVIGGSVGPGGNVTVIPKKLAKTAETRLNPIPSASGGITGSSGTSIQKEGLIDLNGDGLPDFYDGSKLHFNNGSGFVTYGNEFGIKTSMTESTNMSLASNFSLGNSYGGQEVNSLKSGTNLSMGGSYSASSSTTEKMFMDINGDGLPDIISMKPGKETVTVSYNTGNGFVKGDDILLQGWGHFVSDNISRFRSHNDDAGFDLEFIGRVPMVGSAVNKGLSKKVCNPYGNEAEKYADSLEWSSEITAGISGSLGTNVDITFDIITVTGYYGTVHMTCNAGEGVSTSSSVSGISVRMADLDGDGLADHVLRVPGYGTYWKRNLSGKIGLLKQVNLPQGGSVEIGYAEKYGTVYNPNFKYVMDSVTMNDGTDGEGLLPRLEHGWHSVTTLYDYDGGYYDRQKKEFYGFKTVRATLADGSSQTDEYYNLEYYSKGCIKKSSSHSKDGQLLSESRTELCPSPVALPLGEESWGYEMSSGNAGCIHTSAEYEYDGWGNCTKVTQDFGGGQKLTAEIAYDNSDTVGYIIGLPVDIRVYGSDDSLMRRREGRYDRYGQLEELHQYYDAYNYTENKISYDDYGNIKSMSDSRGATVSYSYDKEEHMLATGITQKGKDTEAYASTVEYDMDTQTKTMETDCNGNTLKYKYDAWQRITEIFTAYDGSIPAVRYEYSSPYELVKDGEMTTLTQKKHDLWYAVTENKVTFDAKDSSTIQTVIQVDGLGRAVRTAKTGCVNGKAGWNASGAVEYDCKGRTVKEGMTEFIGGTIADLLQSSPKMTELFTSYEYDEKDRPVTSILPDNSVQKNAYYMAEDRLVSESTDPLGNVSVQEADGRGNIVRVARKDSSGRQLTEVTYEYNEMGEMLKAFDAKGHPISVEYDLLGRRTALESLDSGRQEFFYDECSNLVRENNSVLRENNKQILYEYDGLNRLARIDYPDTEDTSYTYGKPSDSKVGAAGKILSIEDASGKLSYEYGKLGEVTKETRTLATHLNGSSTTETAVMEYRADYLGRMQWIVYPDKEKVTYGYDCGGQVVTVKGEHYGRDFPYVNDILYDQYGQRTKIVYGNGTETEYSYDSARRWLDTIKTCNKWGKSLQNITYSFDAVGNVLGYENNCLDVVTGNYRTSQTYSYDNLYQLVKADGETVYDPNHSGIAPEFKSKYSQIFEFDADGLGNMTGKASQETVTPQKSIGDNLNYSFKYVYDENYAHRLVSAGERYYKYDSNGNIVMEQDGSFEANGTEGAYHRINRETDDVYSTDYGWGLYKDSDGKKSTTRAYSRTYDWNERNQLVGSADANYTTTYVYGQDGQRSNKYTKNSETLYFNKMWTHRTDSGLKVYGGQTAKNIYLGETRIVTKLNAGSNPTVQEESDKQYFYHSDHLGSASLISDCEGNEYQRIEYTPYGEIWVEKTENNGLAYLPYKFTGKEMDEETGLYYYGARYLDPKYSHWMSTDPALGEYMSGSNAGMGGAYNSVNLNLYHYGNNNPIRYTDPDGQIVETAWDVFSLVTGVASFVENVKEGNVKGAIIDGLGIVADAVAVAVPCVPGGAGAAIKAAKVASAVADVAGGALTAQDGLANGDYLEAASGVLQAVSGVSSLSKVTKAADTISEAGKSAKVCHGNSRASTKPQHGYEIYNAKTGNVAKTGISGQPLNKNGTSPRANRQVNQFNKDAGNNIYAARVVEPNIPDRASALDWEKKNTTRLYREGNSMNKHKYPRPEE